MRLGNLPSHVRLLDGRAWTPAPGPCATMWSLSTEQTLQWVLALEPSLGFRQ